MQTGESLSPAERIQNLLALLYGEPAGRAAGDRLAQLLDHYRPRVPAPRTPDLTSRDAILIIYADQVQEPGTPPLRTLADLADKYLAGPISTIHLLPFYPYSSDDGFAVMDYRAVHPAHGDWDDVARLGRRFRLMFDLVLNHVSAQHKWFQGFLRDDPRYRDYFIAVPAGADLSHVVRPRARPLLTHFATPDGEKAIWTTFSPDQVDLNYHQPDVLLEMVDVLLFYVTHGAEFIRLDAIAYLWKEFGTTCLHRPQTHQVVQLLRAVLDAVAPHVRLITETNVPHVENLSYLGDGRNEAQLVYNFALPPLVLHAFQTGSTATLARWAAGLSLPSKRVTFLNFLASHDGIGLNPARGILTEAEIDALVAHALAHGGRVSYKDNPDGTPSPYELNVNYFDALSDPNAAESLATQVDRFMAAQAIMLALVGVPGIYVHSLFGSRGWAEGVRLTGHNRAINRERWDRAALERELADPTSRRSRVFRRYRRLLRVRAAHPAFHPHGEQRILDAGPAIFAVLRRGATSAGPVLCLHNVSGRPQTAEVDLAAIWDASPGRLTDLLTGRTLDMRRALRLGPYQVRWLTVNI